jgi:hypothetical protein
MNIERIKSALATGGEHLGDLLWWHLGDARIDRAELESIWTKGGLDAALLPDAPTAEKALKLAAREAQVGQRERLIRLGKEDEHEIVFAIVHEHRHEDGSLTFRQEARVVLARDCEALSSEAPTHDVVESIKAKFDVLRTTHTPDDVRRAIVKALRSWAAVTLRDHGGVYWSPPTAAQKVRRLQAAIEQIGSSLLSVLPVHRSVEAERTLGGIARASIEEELAALQTEITSFMQAPPERASTLARRLEMFDELRARARVYREVLHVQVQDLDRNLDQLAASVSQLLDQKSAA